MLNAKKSWLVLACAEARTETASKKTETNAGLGIMAPFNAGEIIAQSEAQLEGFLKPQGQSLLSAQLSGDHSLMRLFYDLRIKSSES